MPRKTKDRPRLRIAAVVEEQGRLKTWLAARMGVTPSHLTYLMRGDRVWTEERKQLCLEALGLSALEAEEKGLFEYPDTVEGDDGE